jgi:myosin heavy subunit
VKQQHHSHERFISDNLHSSTTFGVYHFAGPVLYDASKFIERNTDTLPDFLISVVATTTNGLIAQELIEIMKRRSGVSKIKKVMRTNVIDVFQLELKQLLSAIDDSHPRYIRCIKPCDDLHISKKIDHTVFLRQLKSTGLVTAIELTREIFPDKLSFEIVARRYSCLLPTKMMTSIEDMDIIDRAQVILSCVYAPIIEKYQGSNFAMPFTCGNSKVFFREGAVEILEGQRQTLCATSSQKIQKSVRKYFARYRYLLVLKCFTTLQALYRRNLMLREFRIFKASFIKVQSKGRSIICRGRFIRTKATIILLQRWWVRVKIHLESRRNVNRIKMNAGLVLSIWIYDILRNQKLKYENISAMIVTFWFRARVQRLSFLRKRQAAIRIEAWIRFYIAKSRFKAIKNAANVLANHRRLQLTYRLAREKKLEEKKQMQKQHIAVLRIQSFLRAKQLLQSNHSPVDESSTTLLCDCDLKYGTSEQFVHSTVADKDIDFVLAPRSVVEQASLYKCQIEDLKNDITLLTSEAELHKQEVEAEFEDRLAAYEDEVLQLKQSIDILKVEKIALKDEIAANVENVQNLKTGIQSMHEAHREYLNKVMRAVENANREHQIALECVKLEKDNKIKQLTDEIDRLQNERQDFRRRNENNRHNNDKIYHMARKIEKVTAPHYVTALAKRVRKVPSQEDYVEEKLSGRVRQYLYTLEDLATSTMNRLCGQEEYILSLQEQLQSANAQIEKMQEQLECSGNNSVSVGRRGIKKFFER